MKFCNTLIFVTLSLVSSLAFATTVPNNFPQELIYKDQPIDPLCFEGNDKSVTLEKCGIKNETERKISGQDAGFLKKGYFGFDYKQTADNSPIESYSYYKVLGKYQNLYVIYHISSGGGSGVFTKIVFIKRNGDNLTIDTLRGGDRCNGGIDDAKLNKNILSYNVSITPFDYLDLAGQNPHNLKAYDDLASCAACCLGSANFQTDLSQNPASEKLIKIELGTNIEDATSNTQGTYQECFNKLLKNFMSQGKMSMNPIELKAFIADFNSQCVPADKK